MTVRAGHFRPFFPATNVTRNVAPQEKPNLTRRAMDGMPGNPNGTAPHSGIRMRQRKFGPSIRSYCRKRVLRPGNQLRQFRNAIDNVSMRRSLQTLPIMSSREHANHPRHTRV